MYERTNRVYNNMNYELYISQVKAYYEKIDAGGEGVVAVLTSKTPMAL